MDHHEFVMAAQGDLIDAVGLVFDPVANVTEQHGDSFTYFVRGDAQIFLAAAIRAGPLPGLAEHATMQVTDVRFGERVTFLDLPGIQGPDTRSENIFALPLIEFVLSGEAGYEAFLLVRT